MGEVNWGEGKRPAKNYKIDKPGSLGHTGPFIAEVMNTVDPARMGRIQVWVRSFGDENTKYEPSSWFTVRYLSPFYGVTQHKKIDAPESNIEENGHSYGFWMNAPDVGTEVLVVFAEGDPNQGFYIGCIPEAQMNHMIPAIGAQDHPHYNNSQQESKCVDVPRVPVGEIDKKESSMQNIQFTKIAKPVHSIIAGQMWSQGLVRDTIRGPITSSAQRESPSHVYGFSSPGRPIYATGVLDKDVKEKVSSGEETDISIKGRKGGHTFVMDDGDLAGNDTLIRIRTSAGHQIMMNDSGETLYISHANGKTWIELGKEGTVDIYAANSVNIRTGGELNLHADKNININALENINMYAGKNISIEAEEKLNLTGKSNLTVYSKTLVGIKSDGQLYLDAGSNSSIKAGGIFAVKASQIGLNHTFTASSVTAPSALTQTNFADTLIDSTYGWKSVDGQFKSVTTRAPTHEPYAEHGKGVSNVKQPKTNG